MDEHLVNIRPPVWLPIVVVLLASAGYVGGKMIEVRGAYEPVLITVEGEGKVTAVPDIAELTFGVQTGPQPTAKAAMDKLTRTMSAAFEAVKALGIEEKDISTESLSLNPSYDWSDGRQTLRGYEANQQLRVKVRDLDKVSDVLSAATNAGANQAGGVQFTIDDPEALRAEARAKAIENARQKAEVLAQQLGVEIDKLRSFSESGGTQPPMPYYAKTAVMEDVGGGAMDAGVPLPPGEQEVHVTVSVTYEVED